MSYKGFDWIDILMPEQRAAELAKREATNNVLFANFPPKRPDEVDRIMSLNDAELLAEAKRDGVDLAKVGREGREAFERAVNIVDGKKVADAIMDVCDQIGGNPHVVIDRRAWQHLLVYIPLELLQERIAAKTSAALPGKTRGGTDGPA